MSTGGYSLSDILLEHLVGPWEFSLINIMYFKRYKVKEAHYVNVNFDKNMCFQNACCI